MSLGVCMIAYGKKARQMAYQCQKALLEYHRWPVAVDEGQRVDCPPGYNDVQRSRYSKTCLLDWSPFDQTLYLDVDTQVNGDIGVGFEMLGDGYDLVITPSTQQGTEALWHIGVEERLMTLFNMPEPLQLQGGVFWVRRCAATEQLFRLWRYEWLRWEQYDQGALLRALFQSPVRVYLLGRAFNGGALVAHHYGQVTQ